MIEYRLEEVKIELFIGALTLKSVLQGAAVRLTFSYFLHLEHGNVDLGHQR